MIPAKYGIAGLQGCHHTADFIEATVSFTADNLVTTDKKKTATSYGSAYSTLLHLYVPAPN